MYQALITVLYLSKLIHEYIRSTIPPPNPSITPLYLTQPEKGMRRRSKRKQSTVSNIDKPLEHNRKMPIQLYFLIEAINRDQAEEMADSSNDQAVSQINCGNKLCTKVRTKGASEDGWSKRKIGEIYTWLCEDCSNAFVSKQYCDFCKQIYTDVAQEGAVVDGLEWILCESCGGWTHIECEAEKGYDDIRNLLDDPQFTYNCPECENAGSLGKKKKKTKGVHTYVLVDYG